MERGANVWMRSAARSDDAAAPLRRERPSATRSSSAPSTKQDGGPHGDPPGSDAGSMRTAKSTAMDLDISSKNAFLNAITLHRATLSHGAQTPP